MPDPVWQKTGGVLIDLLARDRITVRLRLWHPLLRSIDPPSCSPSRITLRAPRFSMDHTPFFWVGRQHCFIFNSFRILFHMSFSVERPSIASIITLSTYIIRYATSPTSTTRNSLRHPFLFSRFPILSHSGGRRPTTTCAPNPTWMFQNYRQV